MQSLLSAVQRFVTTKGQRPIFKSLAMVVAMGVVLFVVSLLLSSYDETQLARIASYACVLAGLCVLLGDNGQVSLGQGALMAVGGYALALLEKHQHLPLVVELLIATAVSALAGLVLGIPASRLRGPYLAGMTLALAAGLPLIAIRYPSVFGGEEGYSVPPPTPPGSIDPEKWLAWISCLGALVVFFFLANLRWSKYGRAMRAVRDNEVGATVSGISVMWSQVLAFTVASAAAGLGGALMAFSSEIVNPGTYPLSLSISVLAGSVIGGSRYLLGAWWGAIVVTYLPSLANFLSGKVGLTTSQQANFSLLLYGALLVVVMLLVPGGIQEWVSRALKLGWGRIAAPRFQAARTARDLALRETDSEISIVQVKNPR